MDSIGKPQKLIKYASEDGIAKGEKLTFTTRMRAYSVVLTALVGVLVFLLATRDEVQATVLRTPGMLYQEDADSVHISNIYNLKLINKTHDALPVQLKLEDVPGGTIKIVGQDDLVVPKEGALEKVFFINLEKAKLKDRKTPLKIGVYTDGKKIETLKTNFLGPFVKNKK